MPHMIIAKVDQDGSYAFWLFRGSRRKAKIQCDDEVLCQGAILAGVFHWSEYECTCSYTVNERGMSDEEREREINRVIRAINQSYRERKIRRKF